VFSTLVHAAAMCVAVVTAACAGSGSDTKGGAATDSTFKVALLTPGPISDQSWNGGAYDGLLRIRDSLHAQVSHVQTKTPAEFEENFRQYGAQHYDLVFGHGFEFQDAAVRVAPEYPSTIYVTTSGNTVRANVAGILFDFDPASYLAGVVAGALTTTNVVGTIGGTELPPVRTSFQAFAAGARAQNPRVSVLTSYIGNWDDVSAGKEQALAQIARHADVIFQNADAAGLGVFNAARESKGVAVIGSNSDQNGVAPEITLGSVVIDLPRAFLLVARDVRAGTFTPRVVSLGMADSVVRLVLNPATASRITPQLRTVLDTTTQALLAGRLRPAAASTSTDSTRHTP
jgi:basic membrane lipoprotein Med (substrate-binding protein (PBP1-ABC) superfamily)